MRFQVEIEIDRPRERVVELFLDPDNLIKWQPGFVSLEQIEGVGREVGAKTRQIHTQGGRETELIETITVNNHPDEFAATYEGDGIWNLIENRFSEIEGERTRWELVSEFQCSGLMIKLMTIFTPGLFKRHTMSFMKEFKSFSEASAA